MGGIRTFQLDIDTTLPLGTVGATTSKVPATNTDVTNKLYVDTLVASVSLPIVPVAEVEVATATVLPSSTYSAGVITASVVGALSIDGVEVKKGQRVLVKNEAVGTKNGLYDVTNAGGVADAFELTRTADTIVRYTYCISVNGTVNKGKGWCCTNSTTPVIGTDNITFALYVVYEQGTDNYYKKPVRVATPDTTLLTYDPVEQTITIPTVVAWQCDGVTVQVGDRVLNCYPSVNAPVIYDPSYGIYDVTDDGAISGTAVLKRSSDFNVSDEALEGSIISVTEGTKNGGKLFMVKTGSVDLDNTAIAIEEVTSDFFVERTYAQIQAMIVANELRAGYTYRITARGTKLLGALKDDVLVKAISTNKFETAGLVISSVPYYANIEGYTVYNALSVYAIDEKVIWNGQTWKSLQAANTGNAVVEGAWWTNIPNEATQIDYVEYDVTLNSILRRVDALGNDVTGIMEETFQWGFASVYKNKIINGAVLDIINNTVVIAENVIVNGGTLSLSSNTGAIVSNHIDFALLRCDANTQSISFNEIKGQNDDITAVFTTGSLYNCKIENAGVIVLDTTIDYEKYTISDGINTFPKIFDITSATDVGVLGSEFWEGVAILTSTNLTETVENIYCATNNLKVVCKDLVVTFKNTGNLNPLNGLDYTTVTPTLGLATVWFTRYGGAYTNLTQYAQTYTSPYIPPVTATVTTENKSLTELLKQSLTGLGYTPVTGNKITIDNWATIALTFTVDGEVINNYTDLRLLLKDEDVISGYGKYNGIWTWEDGDPTAGTLVRTNDGIGANFTTGTKVKVLKGNVCEGREYTLETATPVIGVSDLTFSWSNSKIVNATDYMFYGCETTTGTDGALACLLPLRTALKVPPTVTAPFNSKPMYVVLNGEIIEIGNGVSASVPFFISYQSASSTLLQARAFAPYTLNSGDGRKFVNGTYYKCTTSDAASDFSNVLVDLDNTTAVTVPVVGTMYLAKTTNDDPTAPTNWGTSDFIAYDTPQNYISATEGDFIFFNPTVAGYDLSATDKISVIYPVEI